MKDWVEKELPIDWRVSCHWQPFVVEEVSISTLS